MARRPRGPRSGVRVAGAGHETSATFTRGSGEPRKRIQHAANDSPRHPLASQVCDDPAHRCRGDGAGGVGVQRRRQRQCRDLRHRDERDGGAAQETEAPEDPVAAAQQRVDRRGGRRHAVAGGAHHRPRRVLRPPRRATSRRSTVTAACSPTAPRRWVTSRRSAPISTHPRRGDVAAADGVSTAKDDLAAAQQELVDAQAALAAAIATGVERAQQHGDADDEHDHDARAAGDDRARPAGRGRPRPRLARGSPTRHRWSRPRPTTTPPRWRCEMAWLRLARRRADA